MYKIAIDYNQIKSLQLEKSEYRIVWSSCLISAKENKRGINNESFHFWRYNCEMKLLKKTQEIAYLYEVRATNFVYVRE
jgi:hypothetical protein